MRATASRRAGNHQFPTSALTNGILSNDKMKEQEGKKATPQPAKSSGLFGAKMDSATRRLLTPREQWTPAQKRADKRAEDAAHAQGSIWYEQMLALLRAGDLAGAVQAITPSPGGPYVNQAVEAVARAQVQAGELLAAVATAQRLPYPDTKGEVIGAVVHVLVQRGDLVAAQWLAATVTGFRYVDVMKRIAEAQQQAGDTEAARLTLRQARERAEGFSEGDMKNGYFRSYYLSDLAKAQVQAGDVAGAIHTAQLITHQEEQGWALRAIAEGTLRWSIYAGQFRAVV
jgi:hypothetical protein